MRLSAYGLCVDLDVPMPAALAGAASPGTGEAQLRAVLAPREEAAAGFSGPAEPRRVGERRVDGRAVRYESGAAGDLLIEWEDAGVFHLDQEGGLLRCWGPDPEDPAWQRFVLDSALGSAALRHGAEALHAGAVAHDDGATAVAAGMGGGKTSLVAELLARGASLVADDIVAVQTGAAGPLAHPGPPVMNLARQRAFGPAPEELGTVVADIGGEAWVVARNGAVGPVPLRVVVLLDRGDHPAVELERVTSPVPLLAHVLHSGSAPGREAARFDMVSSLVQQAEVLALRAPLDVSPAALAEAIASR